MGMGGRRGFKVWNACKLRGVMEGEKFSRPKEEGMAGQEERERQEVGITGGEIPRVGAGSTVGEEGGGTENSKDFE